MLSSVVIAPERVREETLLAPFLLQEQGFIVDLLSEHLGEPLSVKVLRQEMDRIGFVREGLISTGDLPLYLATTVISRLPATRALIATLKKNPTMFFGEALRKHRLFHHKTPPEIRHSEYIPEWRNLFGADGGMTHVWERTYAIVTPRGKRIAGVTEIFSPKLEALLREHPQHQTG